MMGGKERSMSAFPCEHCKTPIALYGIYPKEADGAIHNDRRCMSLVKQQRDDARAEVARLTPRPIERKPESA